MSFNSIEFSIFLPIVFAGYWILKNHLRWQNFFVLVVSYVFYGWWSWKFLFLIAFTSLCSYLSGLAMNKTGEGKNQAVARKVVLWGNIVINIGILGIFKYYDFFAARLAALIGVEGDAFMLHLVLPAGISFYTFQALSYTIDIYKGKIEPTRDIEAFFAYIAFFPQLVAGPIERATNLLPQFLRKREFNYDTAVDGARQILWGLFKKMVVADSCAIYVNNVFSCGGTGSEHLIAAVLFAFQIYGDFSGYSDIAIGTAKLFGINLRRNFANPYFSRDIAEFWRRWHISLNTWFRDYIYIPLGGSRVCKWKVVRNTFIIFLVSGIWHGSNWTFLAWGFYHACLFLPLLLLGKNRKYTDTVAANRVLPTIKELGQMALTFLFVVVGWVIFRATSISSTVSYFREMLSLETLRGFYKIFTYWVVFPIIIMLVVEWINRNKEYEFDVACYKKPVRYCMYIVLSTTVVVFLLANINTASHFIYFQF